MPQRLPTDDASPVLYCAGRPGSVDESFYRWVLRGSSVRVVPLGGHRDIVRHLQEGGGEAKGAPRCGVVDRDAWPDEALARQSDVVEVLPYFEVESYFVHPELLGPALADSGRPLEPAALVGLLLEAARSSYMVAINAHLSHAPKARGRDRLEEMARQYAGQLRYADSILERGNVDALLRYFPGRRLAQCLARDLDFLNPQHLVETVLRVPGLRERCRPVQDLRSALLLRLSH